jgi:hypothetical protein
MIGFTSKGSFKNIESFLATMTKKDIGTQLDKYGAMGVAALSSATPVESGLTAASWYYEVVRKRGSYSIMWRNSHVVAGQSVVILLHYGHGTGTGGYVQGRDFINPSIRPIFDQIAADVWKVVTSA